MLKVNVWLSSFQNALLYNLWLLLKIFIKTFSLEKSEIETTALKSSRANGKCLSVANESDTILEESTIGATFVIIEIIS